MSTMLRHSEGLLDRDTVRLLAEELALPEGALGRLSAAPRRSAITEALQFPLGESKKLKSFQVRYEDPSGEWSVALGKPGKEYPTNPNDMTPVILKAGEDIGYRPSFADVFNAVQNAGRTAEEGAGSERLVLEILGALFFRNAFMLDHAQNPEGTWGYQPPPMTLSVLKANCPSIDGHTVELWLHLVEALALNEDVKYNPDPTNLAGRGRQNTLATCAHVCAVFAGTQNMADFIGAMSSGRGVAPLSQKQARECLALLKPGRIETSSIADQVIEVLRPYLNLTFEDIREAFAVKRSAPKYKSVLAYVVRSSLLRELGPEAFGALLECIMPKTVRITAAGELPEDVSFSSFREEKLLHETWQTSELRRDWSRPFLFTVFTEAAPERLLGVYLAEIEPDVLDANVRDSWEKTVHHLRRGERGSLPKMSQSDFFVRTHSGKKRLGSDGENTTPLSFWISRRYVRQMLRESAVWIGRDFSR